MPANQLNMNSMSKQLFLVRHAEAEALQMDVKDIHRRLTDKGCQDAMRMGHWLHTDGHTPDSMLSSTANRTRQTSQYLCEQLAFSPDKIEYTEDLYESSVRLMLSVLEKTADHHESLFVVAHNPSISFLGEFLTGDIIGNVPPGAVMHLSLQVDSWKELSQDTCLLQKYYVPPVV